MQENDTIKQMFTGLIESTAAVLSYADHKLILERPTIFDDIAIGSSICVSGVCLSVVEMNNETISFDVVGETLEKTTIGSWKNGDRVNMERSMKADARLDGHIVQGHVEGRGTVQEFEMRNAELRIKIPDHLLSNIVTKGSIAIDGVSLTVANLENTVCTVALIPQTLSVTTLGSLKVGDHVNVETDILTRRSPSRS